MVFEPLFRELERVARHLPFPVHDSARANDVFGAWRRDGNEEAKRQLDLWTYCFVRRFVLMKFAADRTAPLADFEMLVERIYRKIERKRTSVADPNRYTGWVSVVCRNTYFNYLRSTRILVPLGDDAMTVAVAEPDEPALDASILLDAVHASIEQLPSYLRHVAHLRLIEDLPYDEVSRRTGLHPAILRAYVCKIVKRLRRDDRLKDLVGDTFSMNRASRGYT